MDLAAVTHEGFAPYVGQTFAVQTPDGEVTLTLDNVKLFENSTIRDNRLEIDGVLYPPRKAFALTFEGPREPVLPPVVYTIFHPQTGPMELFLSGFRQDHDCMLYECVFN